MKIRLYRRDFIKNAEVGDFFDEVLRDLKIPEDQREEIDSVEVKVEDWTRLD